MTASRERTPEVSLIIPCLNEAGNAALYEELGDLYAKMGDYRDAKESYEAAIELNSSGGELNKKLSQSLEKLKKPDGSQY